MPIIIHFYPRVIGGATAVLMAAGGKGYMVNAYVYAVAPVNMCVSQRFREA